MEISGFSYVWLTNGYSLIIFLSIHILCMLVFSFFAKSPFLMTVNDTLPVRCNISSVNYTGLDANTLHSNIDCKLLTLFFLT